MSQTVKEIARKWYQKIVFPAEYDKEFEQLLQESPELHFTSFEEYGLEKNGVDAGSNLIMLLYFCEQLEENYRMRGIPAKILMDTISDVRISVQRYRDMTGKLGLQSLRGFAPYLSMQLFRLGRLQFCMTGAPRDIPEYNIKKGDNVMDVHIPKGGPLLLDECKKAIQYAEEFFQEFFSDYVYQYYICFSWLLDEGLQRFLDADSNILQFQKLFDVVYQREEDSILHFMFKYGFQDRSELKECIPTSTFAEKVKEYALAGGVFYNVLGVMRKE